MLRTTLAHTHAIQTHTIKITAELFHVKYIFSAHFHMLADWDHNFLNLDYNEATKPHIYIVTRTCAMQ